MKEISIKKILLFTVFSTVIIISLFLLPVNKVNAAPAQATPTEPQSKQIIPYYEVWLRWNDVSNEHHYLLSMRYLDTNGLVYYNQYIAQNSSYFIIPVNKITRGHTYRWSLSSVDSSGNKTFSPEMYFRIEYGLEGKAYASRSKNEERIDNSDILNMSELTQAILKACDYDGNKKKRIENFKTACDLFNEINKINPMKYYDESCVPMVYPLVIENEGLLEFLLRNKLFQGHWWKYVLNEADEESFDYYLSKYIIPITIDQRYGKKEIEHTYNLVKGYLGK